MIDGSTYIGKYVGPKTVAYAEEWPLWPSLPAPLDHLPDVPRRPCVVEDAVRDPAASAAPAVHD